VDQPSVAAIFSFLTTPRLTKVEVINPFETDPEAPLNAIRFCVLRSSCQVKSLILRTVQYAGGATVALLQVVSPHLEELVLVDRKDVFVEGEVRLITIELINALTIPPQSSRLRTGPILCPKLRSIEWDYWRDIPDVPLIRFLHSRTCNIPPDVAGIVSKLQSVSLRAMDFKFSLLTEDNTNVVKVRESGVKVSLLA
jgi:hypothetical protein